MMKSSEFDEAFDDDEKRIQGAILSEPIGRHLRGVPIAVAETATLEEAVATMQKQHIGCVLIVGEDGKLTGIFSERDLLNRVTGKTADLKKARVRDFMTPKPETLGPEDRIAWAMNRMHIGGYRHVPIVDRDGRPIGMLSIKDIVDFIVELFPAAVLNLPPDPVHESAGPEGGEG
jgi:CBS domain-containing protein